MRLAMKRARLDPSPGDVVCGDIYKILASCVCAFDEKRQFHVHYFIYVNVMAYVTLFWGIALHFAPARTTSAPAMTNTLAR